jgi:hypothetical protein
VQNGLRGKLANHAGNNACDNARNNARNTLSAEKTLEFVDA